MYLVPYVEPSKVLFQVERSQGFALHCIETRICVFNILATYGTFSRLGYLAFSAEATLVIGYYDYHLMTLSFASFINFQHEKRELDII